MDFLEIRLRIDKNPLRATHRHLVRIVDFKVFPGRTGDDSLAAVMSGASICEQLKILNGFIQHRGLFGRSRFRGIDPDKFLQSEYRLLFKPLHFDAPIYKFDRREYGRTGSRVFWTARPPPLSGSSVLGVQGAPRHLQAEFCVRELQYVKCILGQRRGSYRNNLRRPKLEVVWMNR
uniref:Uncharacterized protein n=1 Tax=Myoviridae sp. ctHaT25 TaxID=2826635 RepID=A0A8S5N920_9CAUD|nr:MAG TPA: hypothetical protein [Myoviridae sp. ctHaT25]